MSCSVRLVGTFSSPVKAMHCLRLLCGLRPLNVHSIFIRGVASERLFTVSSQLLKSFHEGKYMSLLALLGAVTGSFLTVLLKLIAPPFGLIHDLDVLSLIALGSVGGCMLGTLVGAVVGSLAYAAQDRVLGKTSAADQTVISVSAVRSIEREVRDLMQSCGAVSVTGSALSLREKEEERKSA